MAVVRLRTFRIPPDPKRLPRKANARQNRPHSLQSSASLYLQVDVNVLKGCLPPDHFCPSLRDFSRVPTNVKVHASSQIEDIPPGYRSLSAYGHNNPAHLFKILSCLDADDDPERRRGVKSTEGARLQDPAYSNFFSIHGNFPITLISDP